MFIRNSLSSIAFVSFAPYLMHSKSVQESVPLPINLVKEFVGAGHRDIGKVKEMIQEYPNLVYSRYDWGNGDFEEAIEGAGHVGNKEVAEYLISKGARVNLFVLTMLGKITLVKPILEAYPDLIYANGAHGFTLLHHAKIGGQSEFCEYLKEKGLSITKMDIK